MTHFWFSLRRLAHVAGVAAAHLAAHAASLLLARRPRLARRLGVRALAGPQRLRVMLEEMGGAFIKFGQMLALQPDVLSLEYCDALFDLLDRIEPFGYEEVERTFVEETGQTPSELFDSFERRPLATASIGQVHRARTLDGRDVAVKIQRPDAEAEFDGDIRVMAAATGLVRRLHLKSLYWLLEPTEEFIAWTREELDYRSEARYVEQLRRNARANPRECVPAVFWQYTTRRTLVVEFLDGVTVLEYLRAVARGDELLPRRLRDAGFDPAAFARNVIDNFVSDAFRHGMFHADLHPANLLILPGNVVGYVDFGITAVLSRYSRRNLIALTHALVRADFEGMCAPFFNVSVTEADSDPEAFRAGLRRLGASWYETRDGRRQLRTGVTRVMLDMLRLSRRTGVWPERDVVKYIRSAVAADGLITRFAPGFDLGLHLEAVCREHLARQGGASLLSYGAFVNWAAAGGHIIEDGAFRASRFLQRVAAVGPESGRDVGRREGDGELRRRAVLLAAALFATSLLLAADGESARVGVNVFTAASLFIVSVTLTLWQTLRRLT